MAQKTNTQEGVGVNSPPDGPMVRPQEGRVVAGVALAVADRLGMSPGAVRLIWFVLGFFGGLGVLLYVAGWLLIPEEGARQSIAEDVTGRLSDSTTWLGVALIVIAAVTLVTMLGWIRADLAWAVALLGVGVLMYRGNLDQAFGHREPSGDAVSDDPVPPLVDSSDSGEDVATEPMVPAPVRRRRERSILGRLTIGTMFVVLGVMAIFDTSDVIRPAFSHYMAVAVGIVGIGLLVGSVVGRSRGLIVLGLFLVPIMLASSVVTARFSGGWGDPVYRPASLGEVRSHYSLTGGDMELDLRNIALDGDVVKIEGDVGFGRLLVLLPEGVGVDLAAHVGFGDLIILGDHNGGVDVGRTVRAEGDGLIELDLDVGFGALEVGGGQALESRGLEIGADGVKIDVGPIGGLEIGADGVKIDVGGQRVEVSP